MGEKTFSVSCVCEGRPMLSQLSSEYQSLINAFKGLISDFCDGLNIVNVDSHLISSLQYELSDKSEHKMLTYFHQQEFDFGVITFYNNN